MDRFAIWYCSLEVVGFFLHLEIKIRKSYKNCRLLLTSSFCIQEMQTLSVFKNYEPGDPNCRIYVKNLSKQVQEKVHGIGGKDYLLASFIVDCLFLLMVLYLNSRIWNLFLDGTLTFHQKLNASCKWGLCDLFCGFGFCSLITAIERNNTFVSFMFYHLLLAKDFCSSSICLKTKWQTE